MQIDRRNPAVLYARGSAFLARRDFDLADEAFGLLVSEHRESPLGEYGQARVAGWRGNKGLALAHLTQARARAQARPEFAAGWVASQVRADAAFGSLKDDAQFTALLGEPR